MSSIVHVYLVKFKEYPKEFKVGVSTKINDRLQDHLTEHGEFLDYKVYVAKNIQEARKFEREVKRLHSENGVWLQGISDIRAGYTEFVPVANGLYEKASTILAENLQKVDDFCFTPKGKKTINLCGAEIARLRRAIGDLQLIDRAILIPMMMEEEFPKTIESMEDQWNRYFKTEGQSYIGHSYFIIATLLQKDYPEGILHLEGVY